MSRIVELPPNGAPRADGSIAGGWWRDEEDGRILCELCPRACRLKPGDRGFCFVRQNVDGEMLLTTYGRSTGFCIDPIEKKPLNHFLPGTSVLSFGTAGCNLGCHFCQNWDISKSREVERLSESATPETIAEAARQLDCRSVAFTYNDPVIWAEYAIDTARACRAAGIKSVAVTAGYITPQARGPFFHEMDAANVDLKAFTEKFYYELTASHLEPVLETLEWLKNESDVWFEITNLIIPDANDSHDELREMCDWILDRIGDDTPVHFSAFHPDFRMRDRPQTPHETLLAAYDIARQQGLKYVYVGNVDDVKHQSTYCPHCGGLLIERNWYALGSYHLRGDHCAHCDGVIAGRFESQPGDWGRRRLPVQISRYASTPPAVSSYAPELVTLQTEAAMSTPSTPADSSGSLTTPASVPVCPDLTSDQEQQIQLAACEIVAAEVNRRPYNIPDNTLSDAAQKTVMGAFVTLKRQGRLRACCGSLGQPMPIAHAVASAAKRTATEDRRLPTISPTELPHLDLDVTLLYGFEPISEAGSQRVEQVEIGKHGLHIQRGQQTGLLLPSVATEQGYDAEEFLRQVCRKAGLPSTAWSDSKTRLMRFEGHSIPGQLASALGERDALTRTPFSVDDARAVADHCRSNLLLMRRGVTPNFYMPGGPDGDVVGVVLTIDFPGIDEPVRIGNISLRNTFPLQSTLFNICQSSVKVMSQQRFDESELTVELAILIDPAMHGVVDAPDLRGFDPEKRGLLVMSAGHSGFVFDPEQTPQQLTAAAAAEAGGGAAAAAQIFSFSTTASSTPVRFSNVPHAAPGAADRAPAVAGSFYPADAAELTKMVDGFLASDGGEKKSCRAIMLPHAGLVYSGAVAGAVLARVQIPDTVIIIGPKHTPLGVSWAVAPHQRWLIPGGSLESDPALAAKLAEAVPNLELDSGAHLREHGIEVELPFLRRLAPDTKVVGIALAGGGVEQAREFARGLAGVLRELPDQPLLIISSDMNHYATDEENRRLDEMALEAMESLDAERLLSTCGEHNISMCGVLPAAIVMETLKELGQLNRSERVAYATSAEVSGDKSRVVGYAGMILD